MFVFGTVFLVVVGLLLLFGVGTFLFQAGCALADVPDRGYFRALPIYSAAIVVSLPLAAALIWFSGRYDADPNDWFGNLHITAALGSLLLIWIFSGGIYALFLAASLRKGLMIAAIELLLMALSAALLSAIALVVLAFVQISTRPPPAKVSRDMERNTVVHALCSTSRLNDLGTP
jgi:hypothetical protein